MKSKEGVAAAIVLLAITVLAPPLLAGDLDPPGPPAPTMKTLDQIPPTWDQTLQSSNSTTPDGCNSSRFKCVIAGTAVLDKETGLVWEKSPDTNTRDGDAAWAYCVEKTVGSRKGWRLPTVEELASLVNPTSRIRHRIEKSSRGNSLMLGREHPRRNPKEAVVQTYPLFCLPAMCIIDSRHVSPMHHPEEERQDTPLLESGREPATGRWPRRPTPRALLG